MIKCNKERPFHQYGEKHEIKITKCFYLQKIYETTKCMKYFQEVKAFLSDYLHETYSL